MTRARPAAPKLQPRARAVARRRHDVVRSNDEWWCQLCQRRARAAYGLRLLGKAPCQAPFLERLAAAPGDACHAIVAGQLDVGVLAWCSRCGAWAENGPRGLLKACPGVAARHGRAALSRVARGLHPRKDLGFRDALPLERCAGRSPG